MAALVSPSLAVSFKGEFFAFGAGLLVSKECGGGLLVDFKPAMLAMCASWIGAIGVPSSPSAWIIECSSNSRS